MFIAAPFCIYLQQYIGLADTNTIKVSSLEVDGDHQQTSPPPGASDWVPLGPDVTGSLTFDYRPVQFVGILLLAGGRVAPHPATPSTTGGGGG